jgi:hypothetical protein
MHYAAPGILLIEKGITRPGRMKNKIRQTFRKENNLYTMVMVTVPEEL